jgi:hypothetical protein
MITSSISDAIQQWGLVLRNRVEDKRFALMPVVLTTTAVLFGLPASWHKWAMVGVALEGYLTIRDQRFTKKLPWRQDAGPPLG